MPTELKLEFVKFVIMESENVNWHVEGWQNWDVNQTLERMKLGEGIDYKGWTTTNTFKQSHGSKSFNHHHYHDKCDNNSIALKSPRFHGMSGAVAHMRPQKTLHPSVVSGIYNAY